jgi:hypothetical protein
MIQVDLAVELLEDLLGTIQVCVSLFALLCLCNLLSRENILMCMNFHCFITLEVKYPSPGDQYDGLLQLNTSFFQIKISLLDLLSQALF